MDRSTFIILENGRKVHKKSMAVAFSLQKNMKATIKRNIGRANIMIASMRAIGLITNGMTKEDIYILRVIMIRKGQNTSQANSSVANSLDPAFVRYMIVSMKENLRGKNHTGMEFLKRQTEVSTKETFITARNMAKGNL